LTPRRILVLAIRAIGDMVLVTPAIRALAEAFPGASLSVVTEAFAADIFEANPRIGKVHVIDRWAQRKLPWRERLSMSLDWMRTVRRGDYDVVVDLFCGPRSAQMAVASGAPVRVAEGIRGRRFFYTRTVDVEHAGRHLLEQKMQIVEAVTGPVPVPEPEIFLRDEERAEADRRLHEIAGDSGRPFAGLFPGAGWMHKRWPAERFATLGNMLAASGWRVVVFGGTRDVEACREVESGMNPAPLMLTGIRRLRETIALVDRMGLFVSNDTGPMHIAAGLGIPTVGIFGPSDPVLYGPRGRQVRIVASRFPCSPCPQDESTCHIHGKRPRECMEAIPVSAVFEAATGIAG